MVADPTHPAICNAFFAAATAAQFKMSIEAVHPKSIKKENGLTPPSYSPKQGPRSLFLDSKTL